MAASRSSAIAVFAGHQARFSSAHLGMPRAVICGYSGKKQGVNHVTTSALNTRAVLIVDTDEAFREALAQLLETHGYRSFLAENSQQALEWLDVSECLPKLIFLDLEISVMSGPEFISRVQGLSQMITPPEIVIIGQIPLAVPGAAAVLQKPIAVSQLLGLMQRLAPLPEQHNGAQSQPSVRQT